MIYGVEEVNHVTSLICEASLRSDIDIQHLLYSTSFRTQYSYLTELLYKESIQEDVGNMNFMKSHCFWSTSFRIIIELFLLNTHGYHPGSTFIMIMGMREIFSNWFLFILLQNECVVFVSEVWSETQNCNTNHFNLTQMVICELFFLSNLCSLVHTVICDLSIYE